MSDITGSVSVGGGASIKYDVDPDVPQVECSLYYESIKCGSVTLNENDASASIGGSVPDTDVTCKATLTADFSAETVTYSVKIDTPFSKAKTYSGTLVTW